MTNQSYTIQVKIKMVFQGFHQHYSQIRMQDKKVRNSQTSNKH